MVNDTPKKRGTIRRPIDMMPNIHNLNRDLSGDSAIFWGGQYIITIRSTTSTL